MMYPIPVHISTRNLPRCGGYDINQAGKSRRFPPHSRNLVSVRVSNSSDNTEPFSPIQSINFEHSAQSLQTVKGIKLICLNNRSLLPKLEEIRLLVAEIKLHVIGLVETWLSDSIDNQELAIPSYRLYRKDRNRAGGGVAVYVREWDTVDHRTLHTDSMDKLESVWLMIQLPSTRPLIIGCV